MTIASALSSNVSSPARKIPTEGHDFNESTLSIRLPARVLVLRNGALEIFADRRDLKLWQYQLALRLAGGNAPVKAGVRAPETRQRMFSHPETTTVRDFRAGRSHSSGSISPAQWTTVSAFSSASKSPASRS